MIWRSVAACLFAVVLMVTVACSKKTGSDQVIVEIPSGFSGNFVLDMGVRNAAPLQKQENAYVLQVPSNGKAETSTLLKNAQLIFKNSNNGQVWGLSQRLFTTGDGISVGGKIEFFVGTQKEFEAEQQKKNKSGEGFRGKALFVTA